MAKPLIPNEVDYLPRPKGLVECKDPRPKRSNTKSVDDILKKTVHPTDRERNDKPKTKA